MGPTELEGTVGPSVHYGSVGTDDKFAQVHFVEIARSEGLPLPPPGSVGTCSGESGRGLFGDSHG